MKLNRPVAGAAWLIIQPLALNVLAVPATAYIVRRMGPEGYGLWGISASLIAVTLFLTNLGVRTLFVRSVAQDQSTAKEAFAEQLGLRTLLALGAGAVALFACLLLSHKPIVFQCTLIAVLGLLFCAVASSVSDLLYAFERLGESAGITFTAGVALTSASVLGAWAGWGPIGMSLAYLVGPAVSAVLSLWLVQRRFFPVRFHWNIRRFLQLLRESRALAAQLTVSTLSANVEALLVPKLMGPAAYGYFSAGLLPASRLTVVSDGLSTAYYSVISRKWAESKLEAAREAARFLMLSVGVCVLMAVCGWIGAPWAAQILFPENPGICRLVITVTMWALPVLAAAEGMAYCLNASGNHGQQARLTICAAPLELGISAVLIWKLGILGACWSWIIRPAISVLFYSPAFFRLFGPLFLQAMRPQADGARTDLPLPEAAEAR